jgi:hypothetical protein
MSRLKDLFRINAATPGMYMDDDALDDGITQDDHREQLEQDKSILDEQHDDRKLQKEAERRVVTAAEDSLTRLHIIKMGRCPECSSHLRRHLFASICEDCGWHTFDVPRTGSVRIHLRDASQAAIEGDRCYRVKANDLLVIKNELVVARLAHHAVAWIEYLWPKEEIDTRHREVVEHLDINCGWCNKPASPEKDGFHLVHAAFGTTQERYCFCSDECYEAFRKMYPARVDRNCYERNCADCNLCLKRYVDEAEGIRLLAKDFLKIKRRGETTEARRET